MTENKKKINNEKVVKMEKKSIEISNKMVIILFALLSLVFYVFVFTNQGLIDDGAFHIGRIKALAHDLSFKNLKPWIYSKTYFGVGYPLGIFYPDVFLYPYAVLVKLGLNLYASYMLMLIVMNFATGLSAYFCIKKILTYEKFDNVEYKALVIALMYFVYPYRLWDVFFRMAIGESMAFIFIPMIILGVYEIFKQDKLGVALFFGMTGIIYSHILSVVIVSIVLVVYYILNINEIIKKPRIILNTVINAIFTILSTLMVTLPILEMQSFTKLYYQTGIKTFGWLKNNVLGFKIGDVPSIITTIVVSIFLIVLSTKVGFKGKMGIVLGYSIFICTGLFAWGPLEALFSFANILQFPWRLLVIGAMPFAVLVGMATFDKKPVYISTVLFLWLGVVAMCSSVYISIKGINLYGDFSAGRGEYMTAAEEEFFLGKHKIKEIYNEYGIERDGNSFTFAEDKNVNNNSYVLPLGYYKGYEIKDSNGEKYSYNLSEKGFIEIDKKSDNVIRVKYVYR